MPAIFYALVCWSVHLHRAGIQTGVFPVFTPLFLLVVFQQGLDGGNQLFSAQVQRFNFPLRINYVLAIKLDSQHDKVSVFFFLFVDT